MATTRLASLAAGILLGAWVGVAQAQDIFLTTGHWRDDRSQGFQLQALRGAPALVTMAYGACRRVCSTSLRVLEQLQALADQRHVALNFVVIGIDPTQDRPADWADYRAERKLNRPNWQFLSGDEESIRQMANQLGVRYWRYGEHTLHDFKIVLLSADGHVVRSVDRFDQDMAALLP